VLRVEDSVKIAVTELLSQFLDIYFQLDALKKKDEEKYID
jgi:hypothetical protein